MSAQEVFELEIAATIEAWRTAGKVLVPQFITHEIITKHEPGLARTNEHTEFFKHYAYKGHRKDVGAYIAKVLTDEEDSEKHVKSLLLPGFDFVQTHYVIKRGGGDVGVPVDQMTDEECHARAEMIRRRGTACLAHADELDRYVLLRKAVDVA